MRSLLHSFEPVEAPGRGEPPMATVILLDTPVFLAVFFGKGSGANWRKQLEGRVLAVSFITVARLLQLAWKGRWGPATRLELMDRLREGFEVVEVNMEVSDEWGQIRDRREGAIQASDSEWIAASALANGYALLTDDPDAFAGVPGLALIVVREEPEQAG